jgi:glycosyltransferase involved in cell wall biosynthesis
VKRKVLIIVENQSVPTDPRVFKESRSLHENGYEVTVLCPRRPDSLKRYEVIEGIRVYRHPVPVEGHTPTGYLVEYSVCLFWEFLYACWIYLRHGFHVIQGCNPPDDIFLVALPFKLFGVKYIFDHHDANPELYFSKYGREGFLYKALCFLEKKTYRHSDAVMVTNQSYRDLAIGRGGVPSDRVFIVRNGPDPRTFRPVPSNPALKNGKQYLIGYVGCMNIQDGLDILVDVATHVKELGRKDVGFICVGGGPELNKLRTMVKDRSLTDTITFTGRVSDSDLLEILSTADVCVNPDRPCEMNDISTMIKIMEYMALGKPIVQFESKEGRFSAQEASLYADKTDLVGDFANKILYLLDRPEERGRMGEIGRAKVEKELAWEHSVDNLLAAYDRVLGTAVKAQQTAPGVNPDVSVSHNLPEAQSNNCSYVLVTPARNEEAFIEKTIESMIHQTILPLKWVIVDDGSMDQTAALARRYLDKYPWIELVQRPQRKDRHFAAKVQAFNAGFEKVKGLNYSVIGNLDADISFESDYMEFLLKKFPENPDLGVAGTIFKEEGYSSEKDSFEGHRHVAGQCQLFRRECWEQIGGYVPHRAGGIDWMAVITARMKGWETESFRERWFFHHRHLGTAERGAIASSFFYGQKDYYLGGHPLWELFRVAYRLTKPPFLIGGLALGLGYFWNLVRRAPRPVSPGLMAFHRKEQLSKLRAILKSVVKFKRVDNFNLARN